MSDSLAIYLHDHHAAAGFAIDLITSLRDRYSGEPLGQLASDLLVEVQEDREQLRLLVSRVGKASPDLKEAGAWLAEKLSRLKLGHDSAKGLGTFEALETLALGILGKRGLWRALKEIAEVDDRLHGVNFDELIQRAETQYSQVEQSRLTVARTAFA